jgi:hypothetical protein
MFPNVRLLIAAVVASVVALSCGFAMFATFRVNHEPLSRLATGAAPLQLAAGSPPPVAAMPAAADSFGVRFPVNQTETAGAPAAAAPEPDHQDNIEAPSTVASTAARAPAAKAAEPDRPPLEQPAPEQPPAVAQAPEPTQDEAAVAPSEPPPGPADAAAAAPPVETAPPAEPAAPVEQAVQEPNPDSTTTATVAPVAVASPAEPEPAVEHGPAAQPNPAAEAPHKHAHRHRPAAKLAAKPQRPRQARAIAQQPGTQPAGIGGPFVPAPTRIAPKTQRPHQARAIVQPARQLPDNSATFAPPTSH